MKRRAIALLLSVAFLAGMSACATAPGRADADKPAADAGGPAPDTAATETGSADGEAGHPGLVLSKGLYSCNGKTGSGEVRLLYNEEDPTGCEYFYIRAWEEYHLLNQEPGDLSGQLFCAAVLENKAWLVSYEDSGLLTVRLFQKGSPDYTTVQTSVEPGYLEDIFCYFLSEEVGYLFGIGERIGGYDSGFVLDVLLKTADGGRTWEQTAVQRSPVVNWHESVEFVKMLDEHVGILSGRCFANDFNFCERTFVTTDGGMTWSCLPRIPEFDEGYPEVHLEDLRREGGRYVLTVRYGAIEYHFLSFYSTDLQAWTKLEPL